MKTDWKIPASDLRQYVLLLFGVGLYFFSNFQRVAIPGTVFDQLQELTSSSAAHVTALGSAFMYVYAAGQLLAGVLTDRFGGIRTIFGGGILFCLGSLLFPLSSSLPLMYFCRVLTGIGASSIYLSMVKEILRVFPKNGAVFLSLLLFLGYSGGIAAGAPFAIAVGAYGMKSVLLFCGILGTVFYLGFVIPGRSVTLEPVRNVSLNLGGYCQVFRLKKNLRCFFFSGINYSLYYVLQTVLGKKFLQDYCSMAPERAAWVLSFMTAFSALAGFLYAMAFKLLHNRRVPLFRLSGAVSVTTFGGIFLLILCDCRSPWIAAFLLMVSLTSSLGPLIVTLLNEQNEKSLTGKAVAFSNFTAFLFVAFFGNLSGVLLNCFSPENRGGVLVYPRSSYLALFAVLTLFSLVVGVLSLQFRDKGTPEK